MTPSAFLEQAFWYPEFFPTPLFLPTLFSPESISIELFCTKVLTRGRALGKHLAKIIKLYQGDPTPIASSTLLLLPTFLTLPSINKLLINNLQPLHPVIHRPSYFPLPYAG